MYKHTQHSWTAGRLDAELMGRQDLEQYYKGASELKNMLVRRQGYISKRGGTDLAVDLEHLLGHTTIDLEDETEENEVENEGEAEESAENSAETTENVIGRARLIPLLHERTQGFYILLTAGRAYLLSRDGIRLMDGTWARSVADYELSDYADEEVENDKRPYYVAVPYGDGDLADIDYCQSGDTIFLAHGAHRPGKIEFAGGRLAYSEIVFDHWDWKRPAIVSVTKTGVDSGISGAGSKTVQYVCTYVKDGIESQPSEPFAISYQSPWKSGGIMTITCDKGDNEEEPDYYNVYKKVATQFGLIATEGTSRALALDPEVAAGGGTVEMVRRAYAYAQTNARGAYGYLYDSRAPTMDDILNSTPNTVDSGLAPFFFDVYGGGSNDGYVIPLIGGAAATGGATFSFGDHSNTIITRLVLTLDNFTGYATLAANGAGRQYIRHLYSGAKFKVTVRARLRYEDGETAPEEIVLSPSAAEEAQMIAVQTIAGPYEEEWDGADTSKDTDNGLGSYWGYSPAVVDYRTPAFSGIAGAFNERMATRTLDVDFSSQLADAFGDDLQMCQIESITVEAYRSDGTTAAPLRFCGVRFYSSVGDSRTVEDEYVTPDMSLTPPVAGNHFKQAGDYPACVGMYKQRLVFAATRNDPFTFWMSRVGDLYDFTPHESIREDDAIEATLSATEFPQVRQIAMNRDLMMFADSGEWKVSPVSGNTLSYKTISADMQSALGSAPNLKPISVGDELLFIKAGGETLLATRYAFQSDGYESNDLSVLSQWIFRNNPIVRMAYRQNPESTVWCVLADGTLAALVYMKEHQVCAWSRCILGGGWKAVDIATSRAESNGSTEIAILVEKSGVYALWRMRDEIPIRDSAPLAADHLCMDGMVKLQSGDAVPPGMTAVACGSKRLAGYVFAAELKTVRPEPPGNTTIQFDIKNAKDFEVRVLDSGGFSVAAEGISDAMATQVPTDAAVNADGTVGLISADIREVLSGDNSGDGRVRIVSEGPMPLNVLSVSVNYEIQPLSGSAG